MGDEEGGGEREEMGGVAGSQICIRIYTDTAAGGDGGCAGGGTGGGDDGGADSGGWSSTK